MPAPATASELRTRVEILRQVKTQDDWIERDKKWVVIGHARVKLTGKRGLESLVDSGITAIHRYDCVMRWRKDLESSDLLRDNQGRIFNIESIDNHEERNRWLVLTVVLNHAHARLQLS